MESYIPAIIMSLREGLEAFLILSILLKFLDKSGKSEFKKQVWSGAIGGILASVALGMILFKLSSYIGSLKTTAKLWESLGAFVAVVLVTTFIVWMIRNGSKIKEHIEGEIVKNLSRKGIYLLAFFMIAREGVEIAIFSFAGKYTLFPVMIGLFIAMVLVILINKALIKVDLKTLFIITLIYLILQAGYLLGYSIHEGLSAFKGMGWLDADNGIFTKAVNLSKTVLNHKNGMFGLPLNVLVGWYSKPEWIQFVIHYGYVLLLLLYWRSRK